MRVLTEDKGEFVKMVDQAGSVIIANLADVDFLSGLLMGHLGSFHH